ncbi:MAG: AbrB family transcriptional regulator [Segniliparus sp.]|uniref:AbrB family transcriptional regulator n=1 Tax=Segniliparus sp. TaxID=2804064 RepID=UPI003F2D097E
MTDTLPYVSTSSAPETSARSHNPAAPAETPPHREQQRLLTKKKALSALKWTAVLCGVYLLAEVGKYAGLPAAQMLIATALGLAVALSGKVWLTIPKQTQMGTQALIGVVMGGYMQLGELRALGPLITPILILTLTTLLLSIFSGWALARFSPIDRTTAALGMMAGGSAAVISAAEDLDADPRIVAFTQYFRLVLIVMTTPFLVTWAFGTVPASDARRLSFAFLDQYRCQGHDSVQYVCLLTGRGDWLAGVCIAVVLCIAGIKLGKAVRLPSYALLGPMVLTAVVSSLGISHGFAPDGIFKELLFILVGLDVGLRFTKDSLRRVWRLFPMICFATVALSTATALIAALAAMATGVPMTDMYLATTPGGINAVVATASSVKANMPLVASAQSLRLLMLVIVLPLLARQLTKGARPRAVRAKA